MIAFNLTELPPSANNLFVTVKRKIGRGQFAKIVTKRVRSERYDAWAEASGWRAMAQAKGRVDGAYSLALQAVCPDKRRRDLDNIIKAVSDLIVALGFVADDSLCQRIEIAWAPKGPAITIQIKPAEILL